MSEVRTVQSTQKCPTCGEEPDAPDVLFFFLLFEIQVGKELYSRTNSAVEQESWTSHGPDMIHTGNDAGASIGRC